MADDRLPWGYVTELGDWRVLPKTPGLIYLGPPPFDVKLPSGQTRRVVHQPKEADNG